MEIQITLSIPITLFSLIKLNHFPCYFLSYFNKIVPCAFPNLDFLFRFLFSFAFRVKPKKGEEKNDEEDERRRSSAIQQNELLSISL